MWARLKFLKARRRLDDEAREEFAAHLELLIERYVRNGMPRQEAEAAARRRLGNVTLVREQIHEINGIRWFDALAQDLRQALRQLRGNPLFSAVVALTLAIGIGGTTAVFTVMHAVLIEPLPFPGADRLVRIYLKDPASAWTRHVMSAPQFQLLRAETRSLAAVGARNVRDDLGLDATGDGPPQRLRIVMVTSDYFRSLGTGPVLGPGFGRADEAPAVERQHGIGSSRVVLSDALWRARFRGDPAVVGTSIRLSGEPYEIAGIAPPGFDDPISGAVDAWIPYDLARDTYEENNSLAMYGRLRDGVSFEQAAAELRVMNDTFRQRWPGSRYNTLVVVPLVEDVTAGSRGLVVALAVGVGLMLLVACVNVANLNLIRATTRVPEFAVRGALGCGRARLARQLMVESLVVAGIGGAAGLAAAAGGLRVLQSLGREALPRIDAVTFDPLVLALAAVLTIGSALVCGVLPAMRIVNGGRGLHVQTRAVTATRQQGRLRSTLAVAQLALALALVAGAGTLSVSFYRLMTVDPGFRADNVLTFDVQLPEVRYDAARRAAFHDELARRLMQVSGVRAAGATSRLPATGSLNPWPVRIESGPLTGESVSVRREHRTVNAEYFSALGIPVLAGRAFDARDDANAPMRAVISADLARAAFPGVPFDQVIGQRISVLSRRNMREIIGVVGDVTVDVYGRRAALAYSSHRQWADNRNWALTQVVAVDGAPDRIISDVRSIVAAIDAELVVHRPAPLADVVGRGASRERFALVLMAAFAGVALTLAALGLYGTLAYTVRQRTPELGIRIVLGATRRDVRAIVFRQAAAVLAAGLVAGTGAALLLGRWLATLLFQVSPSDPRILGATAAALVVVGFFAAWIPAARASRVEPKIALTGS